ncbi:MAG TPA: NADH-dependent oxidoreductase [Tetragenococcus sp.]|nr:NADH-dependent oxidoreductase [Tetragenococcus sp.]
MTKLVTSLTLKHGAVLKTPIAMAPMEAYVAETDGNIGADALTFYGMRSKVAGMIITGATNVNAAGKGFDRQIANTSDENLPGLKRLAQALKKDGNKAILQLYHGGREAATAQKLIGRTLAPSKIAFPFLDYVPEEMTDEEVQQTIADYAAATTRAIKAGFDGVEIHGANHYLIQQFFSAYSNHRQDHWGGSLAKRMNFPLAVTKAVTQAAKDAIKEGFIIGYRFSPEEVHGENVGYTIKESLQLIDQVADYDLDYIHTSLFTAYNDQPVGYAKSFGQLVKETVGDRAQTIIVSNVFGAKAAQDALNYGDIVAVGRQALLDPEFAEKINTGKSDQIFTEVTKERVNELGFTDDLKAWFTMEGSVIPPLPGMENFKK